MRSPRITWDAPTPAGRARIGTFREVVAPEILEVFDDPDGAIAADRPALRSTRLPAEFANLHALVLSRPDGRGECRAWMVFFDLTAGEYSIVGLLREA